MLIVIAIIAILIAVSIPLVNGALERARDATDQANVRAAKAEALLYFMGVTEDTLSISGANYVPGTAITDANKVYYNAADGKLSTTEPTGYGQCTGCGKLTDSAGAVDNVTHVDKVIQVMVDANGVFSWKWV